MSMSNNVQTDEEGESNLRDEDMEDLEEELEADEVEEDPEDEEES